MLTKSKDTQLGVLIEPAEVRLMTKADYRGVGISFEAVLAPDSSNSEQRISGLAAIDTSCRFIIY